MNTVGKRSPLAVVPKPPPRADSLLLRGDDSGVATSADAPSCSGEFDDHDHDHRYWVDYVLWITVAKRISFYYAYL